MAKIPVIGEGQRLAPQNPTGFQGTSGARLAGESLSSAGRGLNQFGQMMAKADRAAGTLAQSAASSYVAEKLRDVKNQYSVDPYDPERRKKFEKKLGDIRREAIQVVSSQYGEKHLSAITQGAQTGGRSYVNAIDAGINKQYIEYMGQEKERLTNGKMGDIFNEPEKAVDHILDVQQLNSDLNEQLGASNELITMETDELAKQGADMAVQGFMAKGNFEEARKVVNTYFKDKYNSEERQQILDKIQTTEIRAESRQMRIEDRNSRIAEKRLKQAQERTAVSVIANIEKASEEGDGYMVTRLMDQLQDNPSLVGLTGLRTVKTAADKGMKESSTIHRYKTLNTLFGDMSDENFTAREQYVRDQVAEGNMLGSVGVQTLKEIDSLRKKAASDPAWKTATKSGKLLLESYTSTDELDTFRFSKNALSEKEFVDRGVRRKGAEAAYFSAILTAKEEGKNPTQVALEIASAYAPDAYENNPPIPGVPQIRQGESREDYVNRLEAHYRASEKYKSTGLRKQLYKSFIEQQKVRVRLDQSTEAGVKAEAEAQSKPVVDEIFRDLDQTLRQEDSSGVPYIYQILEGGF